MTPAQAAAAVLGVFAWCALALMLALAVARVIREADRAQEAEARAGENGAAAPERLDVYL